MSKKENSKAKNKIIPEDLLEKQRSLLRTAEKEIYENITQCLCLARLQLGSINPDEKEKSIALISEASLLIGKAVKDLRNLADQFAMRKNIFYKQP